MSCDHAYAAGLFEGEGNIRLIGRTGLQVSIALVDKAPLLWMEERWATPNGLRKYKRRDPWQDLWVWCLSSKIHIEPFLRDIDPYLTFERRKVSVAAALERLSRNPGRESRTQCVHGHSYTPENTYRDRRGHRRCRTCQAAWDLGRKRG